MGKIVGAVIKTSTHVMERGRGQIEGKGGIEGLHRGRGNALKVEGGLKVWIGRLGG